MTGINDQPWVFLSGHHTLLHGQQAGPRKLQKDLFHVLPQASQPIWDKTTMKKQYGLHYNDECM